LTKGAIDDNSMLQKLPEHLRVEVSLFLNRTILKKVPFFCDSEVGFIKRLAIHLKPQLFTAGEWIIRAGEIGDSMYFISKGEVEVVLPDGSVINTLKAGDFFGEIAIVYKCLRTASVRSVKFTNVFVLSKEDLDHVLVDYPQYTPKIQEIANRRLEETKRSFVHGSSEHHETFAEYDKHWYDKDSPQEPLGRPSVELSRLQHFMQQQDFSKMKPKDLQMLQEELQICLAKVSSVKQKQKPPPKLPESSV